MQRVLAALFALGFMSVATAADDNVVEIDGLKSKAPAAWKREEVKTTMRKAQFRIAKAEGDPEDAELVITYFGKGGGGDKKANIQRWKGQFKDAPAEKTKLDEFKVGNVEVTYLDVQGTFVSRSMSDPNAKSTDKPNFRAINVMFQSPNGPYFIKLIGPAKTIEGQKAAFDDWLKAFK
jgi:hypothetical protein